MDRNYVLPAVENVLAGMLSEIERKNAVDTDGGAGRAEATKELLGDDCGSLPLYVRCSDTDSNDNGPSPKTRKEDRKRKAKFNSDASILRLASLGHYYDLNVVPMVEFHVDLFEDNKEMMEAMAGSSPRDDQSASLGGYLSMRKHPKAKMAVQFGHDESIVRAYTLNDCSWMFNSERFLREKNLCPGVMVSAFTSAVFGFAMGGRVTQRVIDEVNNQRETDPMHYRLTESAIQLL